MNKINLGRILVGGLIATIILFLTDGVLHEHLVHNYWEYIYEGLGAHEPQAGHGAAVLYFLIFEVGRAFTAVLLYVFMRPFFGPGLKTAVFAGLMAWLAFSVTGPAEFIPLGFYGRRLWFMIAAYQLVTSVTANILAAWLYRDPLSTAIHTDE